MTKNNIIEKYTDKVENMILELPSIEVRKLAIIGINEFYFEETGEYLPSFLLERLGTWLLAEVYGDKRTNKVLIEEYPCLSESQELRRKRKIVNIQDELILDVLNYHKKNNSTFRKKGENADV